MRKPKLRLRGDVDGAEVACALQEGRNVLGSASDADVLVSQRGISRRHALVDVAGGEVSVEDLGSKNGTFVNRRRVGRASLRPGDVLRVGKVALVLEEVDAADVELGISSAPFSSPIVSHAGSTETNDTTGRRAVGWIELSRRLVRHSSAEGGGRAAALEELATGLSASGALFSEATGSGDATVLASWGALPSLDRVEALIGRLRGLPRGERGGRDDADPPLTWTSDADASDGVRVLVLLGDFPRRTEAGPLLGLAFELLQSSRLRPSEGGETGRAPAELRFPEGFVAGRSAAMRELCRQLRHLVHGDLPVLLVGETGVGKELAARTLHLSSDRSAGPFVAVNCAAIPAEMLEAEFFGVLRGTATGVSERQGLLESAAAGVVFLDEVGELPLPLQAKLLRALQQREVQPIGARAPRPIDIRVLSATNSDLAARTAAGTFRRDLYHRIAGVTVTVPALRERREDIPQLVERVFRRHLEETGKDVRGITVKALDALVTAAWPGNVRELEHEVRRLVYLCPEGRAIDSAMLSPGLLVQRGEARPVPAPDDLDLAQHTDVLERRLIADALARTRWNKSETARLLGISRNGLLAKLRRLGLDR